MPGLRFSSVAWGDYDNDGYLDILLTGRDIAGADFSKVFRNNGNNTFTDVAGIVLPGVETGSSAWGDFNNDDLLDVVITGYNPSLGAVSKVFKNNGNNTFTEQTGIVLTGVMYSSVAWGDYDNDNYLDLLLTGSTLSGTPVSKIYKNNGNSTFTEQTGIALTGVKQSSAIFGDYNNDGFIDILLCGLNSTGMNVTKLYKNTGSGSYTEQTSIQLQGVSFSSASFGDFDNDNNLDILLTGASSYNPDYKPVTKIYRNKGNNSFAELTGTSIKGIDNGSAEWGDYDNDGLLDIMLSGDTGSDLEFMIYLNQGNGVFSRMTSVNLPGAIACSTSSADYDSDGDLDILISGYSGALISQIYRNNLNLLAGKLKPNTRPEAPTGLQSQVTPHSLKLSWSGVRTDETYYENMSYNVRCRLQSDSKWKVTPQSASDGYRSLTDLGNAQLNRSLTLNDPPSGKYYWQVQAVDQNYSGSAWSALDSVVIKNTQAFFKTDTVCLGIQTTFTDQSVAADGLASWLWDFADGITSTLKNPVHTYATAGTYAVKLTVTSTTAATDVLIKNVIIKPRPTTGFTAPNACIGAPTQLTNTTNLRGLTASSWSWKFGDGQSSAVQNPGTHTYALSGTYQGKLKVIATNGCSDSITNNIIVAKYPEPAISVAGDFETLNGKLTFCDGISLQLSAKSDALYTYQWRMDGNDLTAAASSSYTVSKNSGTYNARIINTLAGCETISDQKVINIKPSPAKPAVISDNYKTGDCVGKDPVKLKVEQSVTGYNYKWLRNGAPINNATSPTLEAFLDQGDYVVAADLNGCTVKSDKFSIAFQGAPEKPLIYAQGPAKWYLACNNIKAGKYIWYFNDKPIDGALKYYYIADQKLGVYRVSVGDDKGCYTRSDSIRIPTDKFAVLPGAKSATDPFNGLKVYPNPSSGRIKIEMDNEVYGEIFVNVINQGGREIARTKFIKATNWFSDQVDLTGQPRGSYLLQIKLNNYMTTNQIILE
jgi:PKD repeat protein